MKSFGQKEGLTSFFIFGMGFLIFNDVKVLIPVKAIEIKEPSVCGTDFFDCAVGANEKGEIRDLAVWDRAPEIEKGIKIKEGLPFVFFAQFAITLLMGVKRIVVNHLLGELAVKGIDVKGRNAVKVGIDGLEMLLWESKVRKQIAHEAVDHDFLSAHHAGYCGNRVDDFHVGAVFLCQSLLQGRHQLLLTFRLTAREMETDARKIIFFQLADQHELPSSDDYGGRIMFEVSFSHSEASQKDTPF